MRYMVIKCGGSVLEALPDSFFADLVKLAQQKRAHPIVVHGGGPAISTLLTALGIKSHFVGGLRVTTPDVLDVVEMVLSGQVNKLVVRRIAQAGGQALGVSGIDGRLLLAEPTSPELGFVGEVKQVNGDMLEALSQQGFIPVISPLGLGDDGQRYNINADMAAAAVAKRMKAELLFVSDIPGVYGAEPGRVLPTLNRAEALQLIEQQVITGGMIPKIRSALDSLEHTDSVVILNGFKQDVLAEYCQGVLAGTRLVAGGAV